jgi:G:T-mismatch repair DNA endonuclease (very short patch repair protein)
VNYELTNGEIATLVAFCWGLLILWICAFMHGAQSAQVSERTKRAIELDALERAHWDRNHG